MISKTSVNFIVIAFNEEKGIKDCIESIQNQKYQARFSIIIVNDGSTDRTLEQVRNLKSSYRNIRLIDNKKNMGRGYSRQIGVKASNADYLAFVDADIKLPSNWLNRCISKLNSYDACGGIALPDGDVQYVYTKYQLRPKVRKHTAEISGCNGLYKREVFDRINFNEKMKDGEDVDLVWKLKAGNYKLFCVDDLIVEHKESKTYAQSLKWLYESGFGANRLLWRYGNIRLPDVSFFIFVAILIASFLFLYIDRNPYGFVALVLYTWLVGFMHLYKSFYADRIFQFLFASIAIFFLIGAYFVGRLFGYITLQR